MRDHPDNRDNLSSPARRHFLHVMSAIAAAAVATLPASAAAREPNGGGRTNARCFLRGTRILSPHGIRRVESLSIGDHVTTVRGEALPIKWIGRRAFRRGESSRWPDSVHPIRVTRSALADNVPHADLYVSPGHALFIDGVLIPVVHLVNGTSITPALPEGMKDVEYFHIELGTHEVIFAEGAPVETLLIENGREDFPNFVEYERLYGRQVAPAMVPYAPVLSYPGGRAHLKALLRLGISHVVDVRDPIQTAYDRIAARGTDLALCST